MAFKQLAIRRLTSEGPAAVVGLAVAIGGGDVWSLVIEELVADLVDLFLLWRMVKWRPVPHWGLSEFRELLGFGAPMLSRSGLEYFVDNGDRFLVGRLFGPETLGLFSVALRLVVVVTDTITNVFERVAFPAFARFRGNLRQSQRGFLQAIRFQAALLFPLMIVVGVLANDLVPWLLGSQWAGAVAFTQILAVRGLLGSMLSLARAPWPAGGVRGERRPQPLRRCAAISWTVGLYWGPRTAAGGVAAAAVLVPISCACWPRICHSAGARGSALAPATRSALMAVEGLAWLVPARIWTGSCAHHARGRRHRLLSRCHRRLALAGPSLLRAPRETRARNGKNAFEA
jgi:PST family polysaccharide transporter